jgi:hypothetical protein
VNGEAFCGYMRGLYRTTHHTTGPRLLDILNMSDSHDHFLKGEIRLGIRDFLGGLI